MLEFRNFIRQAKSAVILGYRKNFHFMLGQHTSWNIRKKIPFQKNIRNFSKLKRFAFFEPGMEKCARFFSFLKIIRNF